MRRAGSQRRPASRPCGRRTFRRVSRPIHSWRAPCGQICGAVEGAAAGPGDDQRRGGEQGERGGHAPGDARGDPAAEEGLGQELAVPETDVADQDELERAAEPGAASKAVAEREQASATSDHGDQRDVVRAEVGGAAAAWRRSRRALEAVLDGIGDGHAGERRAGDAFDAGGAGIEAGDLVPGLAVPGLHEVLVGGDVANVFLGVPTAADADAEDAHGRVQGDQRVGRAGVASDVVGDGAGAEEIADMVTLGVEDEEAAAFGGVGLEAGGAVEEGSHFVRLIGASPSTRRRAWWRWTRKTMATTTPRR